jgi:hypothetical protein
VRSWSALVVRVTVIRNCSDVLLHVAFWCQDASQLLCGQRADDSANELSGADYPTKEKASAVLRSSATEVAAAPRKHRRDLPPGRWNWP